MTEEEFIAKVGRKPTETERLNHGIRWLPTVMPGLPPIDLPVTTHLVLDPKAPPLDLTLGAGMSEAGESAAAAGQTPQPIATETASAEGATSAVPALAPATEDPNVGASPAAASSPAVGDSALGASTGAGTSSIGTSSAELPLHVKVAQHLEAIYRLVKGEEHGAS